MSILIIRIVGGLGNQFFCYAAAKALATRNNAVLYIDNLSGFQADRFNRQYLLDRFMVPEQIISQNKYICWYAKTIVLAMKLVPQCLMRRIVLREKSLNYSSCHQFVELNGVTYMEGYWQSELYFKEISDEIRKSFMCEEIT